LFTVYEKEQQLELAVAAVVIVVVFIVVVGVARNKNNASTSAKKLLTNPKTAEPICRTFPSPAIPQSPTISFG